MPLGEDRDMLYSWPINLNRNMAVSKEGASNVQPYGTDLLAGFSFHRILNLGLDVPRTESTDYTWTGLPAWGFC